MNFKYLILVLLFTITSLNGQNLEIPALNSDDVLVYHTGFILSYNEITEQPNWVAWQLQEDELNKVFAERDTVTFRSDPEVQSKTASNGDYRKSGYDKGHMCPAADMKWSIQAMEDCHYFSNISPQHPKLNREIWGDLEEDTRNLIRKDPDYEDDNWRNNRKVYVVCGPIFYDEEYETIGKNDVAIPDAFFKVILTTKKKVKEISAYIFPNQDCEGTLDDYAKPLNEVESITGIDFFPVLNNTELASKKRSNDLKKEVH